MPLSKAETEHEYEMTEIHTLKAENDRLKDKIKRNETRLEYLDSKITQTAEKLVTEHPGLPKTVTVEQAIPADSKSKPRLVTVETTPQTSTQKATKKTKSGSKSSKSTKGAKSTKATKGTEGSRKSKSSGDLGSSKSSSSSRKTSSKSSKSSTGNGTASSQKTKAKNA